MSVLRASNVPGAALLSLTGLLLINALIPRTGGTAAAWEHWLYALRHAFLLSAMAIAVYAGYALMGAPKISVRLDFDPGTIRTARRA